MTFRLRTAALAATVSLFSGAAMAAECEVTHWWTSGGEAAAVAEFAKAFDATGNKWVDGAIAGGGGTARPVMISRITGGDPMCATQFNHGRQTEELIEAGLFVDLTELAEKENWSEIINPPSVLESCTVDGRVYCVPVNIHSPQWLWLSHAAYEKVGLDVPTNWDEFVAAAPKLREAGILPLALGQQPWQSNLLFGAVQIGVGGIDLWKKVNLEKDVEAARGEQMAKVFQAMGDARSMAEGSTGQDWNEATNMVIQGTAGGQIMGDWAQGEFQVAEQKAGEDYTCLPGLGVHEYLSTGGDAFYFPKVDDPEVTEAQRQLASLMVSKDVQVAFNLKKGSLPIRGDVDLAAANDCMKKGLEILAGGNLLPSGDQVFSADTQTQFNDLMVEFMNNTDITPEQAQERYADIVESAD
ncbi:ABC transporter substrate-binding protein [Aquibium oceanicum]|uniref:Probable sugar-binding periplasmic protein n=1 Tax=Aquibium oceanicum TaxID=1670800 RepID=A0A1L3SW48_9HYPH|nr:ABC transporter substrate-binding protein [Aquibium oceanicum]APH73610.1 ABC transporter substrate-binding protein [Aquibium oceanicum]